MTSEGEGEGDGGAPRVIEETEVLSKTEIEGNSSNRRSNPRVRFGFSVMVAIGPPGEGDEKEIRELAERPSETCMWW